MSTMVALLAAAVMSMCGMCGSAMRAMVLKRSTTTGGCHHYSGNHTEQISQAVMFHNHLCSLVVRLATLLLQRTAATTIITRFTA